jgi:hypothetical protein
MNTTERLNAASLMLFGRADALQDMADLLGVPQKTYWRWQSGEHVPRPVVWCQLEHALAERATACASLAASISTDPPANRKPGRKPKTGRPDPH